MTRGDLSGRVWARLDERLMRDAEAPVCIGLSGGGDSVALLLLAADWAKSRGRRLLALTVDHQLNPESGGWTQFAGEVARAVGADWQALVWDEAMGGAGVSARARLARHEMMAQAARRAGARVLMLAHTQGDVAEGDLMRAQGSTLGRLREWSPSPVWPQGRDIMLYRPLLEEGREVLRDFLRGRGQVWIEDPANADPRYGRSRARAQLAQEGQAGLAQVSPILKGHLKRLELGDQLWAGVLNLGRDVEARVLAAALVCAGGGSVPPRGERLHNLMDRLASGKDFTASLVGARLEAKGPAVAVMREPGEWRRRGLQPLELVAGQAVVWDGRFEIQVETPNWAVWPAQGHLSRLEPLARQGIICLPAAGRASLPVLVNSITNQYVVANKVARVRPLVADRLTMSLGERTQESELFDAIHGATAVSILFSDEDCDRQALGAG